MQEASSIDFASLKSQWKEDANKYGSPLPGRIRNKLGGKPSGDGKHSPKTSSLTRRRHSLAVRSVSNKQDDSDEPANVDIIDKSSPTARRNRSFRETGGFRSPAKGESIRQMLKRFDTSFQDLSNDEQPTDLVILEDINEGSVSNAGDSVLQSSGNALLNEDLSDFINKGGTSSPSRSRKETTKKNISSSPTPPSPTRKKNESPSSSSGKSSCSTQPASVRSPSARGKPKSEKLAESPRSTHKGTNLAQKNEKNEHGKLSQPANFSATSKKSDCSKHEKFLGENKGSDSPVVPFMQDNSVSSECSWASQTKNGVSSAPSSPTKKMDPSQTKQFDELRSTDHVRILQLLEKTEPDELRSTDHPRRSVSPSKSKRASSPKKKKKKKDKIVGSKTKRECSESKPVVPSTRPAQVKRTPDNSNTNSRRKQACIYLQPESSDKVDVPRFNHSEAENDRILQALYNNQSLTSCRTSHLSKLVSAFEPFDCPAGEILMEEGDESDYMFVIDSGLVEVTANECHLMMGSAGDSFGELSLLYNTRRATTILSLEDCKMFRLHIDSFKTILSADSRRCLQKRGRLLQGIRFFNHLSPSQVREISNTMTPRIFATGSTILKKGDVSDSFFVIGDGQVQRTTRPTVLRSGDYFGEDSMAIGTPVDSDYRVISDSLVFVFEKRKFALDLASSILKDRDAQVLSRVSCLTEYDPNFLLSLIKEKQFSYGDSVYVEKEATKACLYIVRSGSFTLRNSGVKDTLGPGASFGEAMLQRALSKSKKSVKATYSVTAKDKCVCAVLSIKDILEGPNCDGPTVEVSKPVPSIVVPSTLSELDRHSILGQGAFGQVWLVSDKKKESSFALKIQSKSFLVEQNQVEAVIQEKVMLGNLKHPFLINLHRTYQDKKSIYFLMDYVQGGELFSLLHSDNGPPGIPVDQAKFYALSLADVLRYLHRGKYVYRDLKPENVMIDHKGYVKLIDFGFCKYLLEEKTYTLCGTPGYLSPEAVLSHGHNHGADHWALGILIYEMLFGSSPFFYEDIDQSELFESIVGDPLPIPGGTTAEAKALLIGLCEKSPRSRLGAENENEIVEHPWFRDIDLSAVLSRKVAAPWQPAVGGPLDTSNFQPDEDDQVDFPDRPLSKRDAKLFEGVF